MTTWHKGPPPSIGWWPASTTRNADALRWWNGVWWSMPARTHMTAKTADGIAKVQAEFGGIEWTDRPADWPERSRT